MYGFQRLAETGEKVLVILRAFAQAVPLVWILSVSSVLGCELQKSRGFTNPERDMNLIQRGGVP